MDVISFYKDYGIPFVTEETPHKHTRPGWINIGCPFCTGNPGYHLGYNLNRHYFRCWRCGWKRQEEVIRRIIGVSSWEAKDLVSHYRGYRPVKRHPKEQDIGLKPFSFPSDLWPISDRCERYLVHRGYNPYWLKRYWQLLAAGPMARLDGISYGLRIVAPIRWQSKYVVSFQARDITNRQKLKYRACPKAREIIHHKNVLYGQIYDWERVIVVEGITDVWRMGPQCLGTFGIEVRREQLNFLSLFGHVVWLFDDDPQAQKQAQRLCQELRLLTRSDVVAIDGDPGGLTQDDADHLSREILGRMPYDKYRPESN